MKWVFAAAQTAHIVSFTLSQAPYPSSPCKLPASQSELGTNVEPFGNDRWEPQELLQTTDGH